MTEKSTGPWFSSGSPAQSAEVRLDELRRGRWKLDVTRIDDETLIALHSHGFFFEREGTPEGVQSVGKKHTVVGPMPFSTGVPRPGVKSPLDRLPVEAQLVAETVLSYGFDDLFPDNPEPEINEKPKTGREAVASAFDLLFPDVDSEPTEDEWDF